MRNINSRLADERGTAVVEFAIVLPILALLLFGILDFGRLLNYWNDENQMAADGARWAAVNAMPPAVSSCTATTWQERLACQADTADLRPDGSPRSGNGVSAPASVTIFTTGVVGDPVKVCVTSSYKPFAILGIGPTITTHGSATMRVEVAGTSDVYTSNTGTDPCS
jgi:hypothetical protein